MARQLYTSEERYLFKKLPNIVDGVQLKKTTWQTVGTMFLCDVDEILINTGDLSLGNKSSDITERIKTMEQLNFQDGDKISSDSILTKYNGSMINNVRSKLHKKRGARSNSKPTRIYTFEAG
jgi:hypothetical protein